MRLVRCAAVILVYVVATACQSTQGGGNTGRATNVWGTPHGTERLLPHLRPGMGFWTARWEPCRRGVPRCCAAWFPSDAESPECLDDVRSVQRRQANPRPAGGHYRVPAPCLPAEDPSTGLSTATLHPGCHPVYTLAQPTPYPTGCVGWEVLDANTAEQLDMTWQGLPLGKHVPVPSVALCGHAATREQALCVRNTCPPFVGAAVLP